MTFADGADAGTVVAGDADVAITVVALDATLVDGERASRLGTAPQPGTTIITMATTDADRQRIAQV